MLRGPPGRGRRSEDGNFPQDAFRVPLKTERPHRRLSSSDLRRQRCARRAELNRANWFVQQYSSSNLIVALCPSSLSIFFPRTAGLPGLVPPGPNVCGLWYPALARLPPTLQEARNHVPSERFHSFPIQEVWRRSECKSFLEEVAQIVLQRKKIKEMLQSLE